MKKLLLLFAVSLVIPLFAGDTEFHGNFLAALEEDNPRIRAGMIVSALEAASSPLCDRNALNILCYDLEGDGFDRPLLLRLAKLMEKYPADFELISTVFSVAVYRNFCPDALLESIAEKMFSIKLKELSAENRKEALKLLNELNIRLLAAEKLELDRKLFDHLTAGADSPLMLELLAAWSVRSMFFTSDTYPGAKRYQQLPDNDFWKSRQHLLAGIITPMPVSSAEEAEQKLETMTALLLPQTPEELLKYRERFPAAQWSNYEMRIARRFNRPDLVKIEIDSGFTFAFACEMKQYRMAKRWIRRKQTKNEQARWMASYYHHRGEYDRVIEMLDSGEVELKNFDLFFIEATANAIHFTKSGKWCHAMLTEIENQGNNCLPVLANTAGYIAADLNIELDRAEKLIRKAVKAFPNESSYLDSLAWVLFRQQKYSEAAQEIQKALKFRPVSQSCCILFFHAAEIHLALGNKKQAREFFDRAVKNFDYNEKLFPDFSPEQIKDLENRLK